MRLIAAAASVLVFAAVARAQDRLVTLGVTGGNGVTGYTIGLFETEISGTVVGPTSQVGAFPPHGFEAHQLASMAGARYVAWLAHVYSGPDQDQCRAYVAVFDRRLRTTRVVPNIELPCGIAKLVGDSRHARVFLQTWATVGGFPGMIASIDPELRVRPIVVSSRLGTAFAYAADAICWPSRHSRQLPNH